MSRLDDPTPTPITLRNLPRWIKRTVRSDRRRYRRARSGTSVRRLAGTVVPNLREPIFVIGADRSGTTFLGNSLSTLQEVSYHHEPVVIKAAARYVYEGRWGYRRAAFFFRSTYAWLMRIHLDGDVRFAEKSPSNSFIVPFLARAFPDARFVHIVRDGRDAALSLVRQPWLLASSRGSGRREPGGYRYGPDARYWVEPERRPEFEATTDLHRCIWSWRRHTEAALAGCAELPAARYHELRYESLVTSPVAEGEALLDFLAIDRPASRAAFDEALGRADPGGVGRWGRELGPDDLATIEAEARPLLRRLGYE